MKNINSLIICIFLTYLLLGGSNSYAQNQIITTISADSAFTLTQLHNNDPNFVIIDVRTPNEYYAGHIQKATNLNLFSSIFGNTLDSIDKNKMYIIHCQAGSRSARALDSMAYRNFKRVYNIQGGINSWKNSHSVTQITRPILMSMGNDTINLGYIINGQQETINVKLTNAANDTLVFSSFTGPNNPNFTTNFSLSHTLLGYEDYNFHIMYNAINFNADTSSILLKSNGGNLRLFLKANGSAVGQDNTTNKLDFKIYPNPAKSFVIVEIQKPIEAKLINIKGRYIKNITLESGTNKIDISKLKRGVYFLRSKSSSMKFIKI